MSLEDHRRTVVIEHLPFMEVVVGRLMSVSISSQM